MGAGSGSVVWRLGPGGDFTIDSDDPYPWFTHPHDPNWSPNHQLVIYDNGNLRCEGAPLPDPSCHSRGQVYELDEVTKQARLVVNVDLGDFAFALGSAQALSDGNYYFNSGSLQGPSGNVSRMNEVRPDGASEFTVFSDTFMYRSHRVFNLYLDAA